MYVRGRVGFKMHMRYLVMKDMNSRKKGHGFERKIAQEMRELGFENCRTSREVSPLRDAEGIDLVGAGLFNVQCKALERAPAYHELLKIMPQNENYNVIFHKRNRSGTVVVMEKEDFYELLNMLLKEKIL